MSFLLECGEKIIETYADGRQILQRRSQTPKPSRLLERHFPAFIPPTTKEKPTKRCILCYEKGTRKESRYWCAECRTGLCPAPCFQIYHSKE